MIPVYLVVFVRYGLNGFDDILEKPSACVILTMFIGFFDSRERNLQ